MTGVLERSVEADAAAPAALGRRGGDARLRVDLRLARRQVWRTKGSSALVLLLVAIPVAAMVTAAVYWQSHIPTRAQQVTLDLGQMASRIEIVGGEDPSRSHAVDNPGEWDVEWDQDGGPRNPELPAPEDPAAVVPAGTELSAVQQDGTVVARTAEGIARVSATSGDVWNAAFAGRYLILDGVAPTRADEAMATPGMLDRLGTRIGDEVVLPDVGRSFTLTGTIRRADHRAAGSTLYLPAGVDVGGYRVWYAPRWQPTVDELASLNVAGLVVYARDLVLDPPAGSRVSTWDFGTQQGWAMFATGSVVAAFCGYLVVLLAGGGVRGGRAPAAAHPRRRRQRRCRTRQRLPDRRAARDRAGGVRRPRGRSGRDRLGSRRAMAIVDDGAVGTFWGAWGFNVPWLMVGGILLFAVLVGTLAALAPARAATRGDVLAALRGARRPVRGPGPAEPWMWLIAAAAGVLVIGAGAVCLGLARFERRPDDATLTAVGGGRGIRRRINAWQGAIIVGIGVVVGTIAGQIPMWGIAQSGTTMRYWEDAPWVWLAALAVGLPVVVTAASWLVPPRRPELTRRTAIA